MIGMANLNSCLPSTVKLRYRSGQQLAGGIYAPAQWAAWKDWYGKLSGIIATKAGADVNPCLKLGLRQSRQVR
jgi:hypothetical protein